MLAVATQTEKERFAEFLTLNSGTALILANAEKERSGIAYAAFADSLEEHGEPRWASYFRTLLGSEHALTIDGSTFVSQAQSGYQGKTVYCINRNSPRMRSNFGKFEYVYSASDFVSYFAALSKHADAKQSRASAAKTAKANARKQPNPFKVGDILHYSYGYDATINQFAEVMSVSGQSVAIRRIRAEQVGEGWATGCKVKPVPGSAYGEEETTKLAYSAYGSHVSVALPVANHKGKQWRTVGSDYETYETDNR
jgi:hypothetical protein